MAENIHPLLHKEDNILIKLSDWQQPLKQHNQIVLYIPFVKEDGYFLPYKSGDIKEEAANSKKAVKILGGSIEDIISFEIPDTDMARTILKIHKTKATPKRFPRKAGLPTKEPIC